MIKLLSENYYEVYAYGAEIGYIDDGEYFQFRTIAPLHVLEEVVAKLKELNEDPSPT